MRCVGLCLLILLTFPLLEARAQTVVFGNGDIFEDGFIFHSRQELEDYRFVQDLRNCAEDRFYARGQDDAPAAIAAALAKPANAALVFRTCTDRKKNTHYFVREQLTEALNLSRTLLTEGRSSSRPILMRLNGGEIRPLTQGLCRAFEDEVFPNDKVPEGWDNTPPQAWSDAHYYTPQPMELGTLTGGVCPPLSDPGYFTISNVPNGLLKSFGDNWRNITTSSSAFYRALPLSMMKGGCTMSAPKPDAQKRTPISCSQMREELRAVALDRHRTFTSIACRWVAGDCIATLGNFDVGFEATDKGTVVTDISYHLNMMG